MSDSNSDTTSDSTPDSAATASSRQDSAAPEGEFASETSQAAAEETANVQASPEHNEEVLGASGPENPSLQKDPSEWVTGGDPITDAQKSYLDTLARQAGEEIPADLTKSEASEQIERLREKTGKDG
jgi:hypothetical protein